MDPLLMWLSAFGQRFSNYSPWTTCEPRDLPLWSFKKFIRKLNLKWIAYHTIAKNLRVLNGTWQLPFNFLPVLTLYEICPSTDVRICSLKQNRNSKQFWTWCFSPSFSYASGASPVTHPGITWIENRGPKCRTCSYILNSFCAPSLHTEMVRYCTSYTSNRTRKIAYSLL